MNLVKEFLIWQQEITVLPVLQTAALNKAFSGGQSRDQSVTWVVSHVGGQSRGWSVIHLGGQSCGWSVMWVVSHVGGQSHGW